MSIDKKSKKKAQLKKNRRTQEMFQAFKLMREEGERVRKEAEGRAKPTPGESKSEEVWSAKVATIRNRLDGSRRESKERWNRFAGTGGEGGRGL